MTAPDHKVPLAGLGACTEYGGADLKEGRHAKCAGIVSVAAVITMGEGKCPAAGFCSQISPSLQGHSRPPSQVARLPRPLLSPKLSHTKSPYKSSSHTKVSPPKIPTQIKLPVTSYQLSPSCPPLLPTTTTPQNDHNLVIGHF